MLLCLFVFLPFSFCFSFLFLRFILLGKSELQGEGGREGANAQERSSICCFTAQMTTAAGAALGRNQEPGAPSRSPTWVKGP